MSPFFLLLGLLPMVFSIDGFSDAKGDADEVENDDVLNDEIIPIEDAEPEFADQTILGTDGDDVLIADSDSNPSHGELSDDYILDGGAGSDFLAGASGDDHLNGGTGEDILVGGLGKDTLYGGDGDDLIVAHQLYWDIPADQDVADVIDAGDGDDILELGNFDVATGGKGLDVFKILGQQAVIEDFDPTQDHIVIELPADHFRELEKSGFPEYEFKLIENEGSTDSGLFVEGTKVPLVVLKNIAPELLSSTEIQIASM